MYFLSEMEHKLLIHKLLPTSREVGVNPELRGWNWHQAPLKPYYDEKAPMYAVCSKYCPTDRDIYLSQVKRVKPELNYDVTLGKILHGVVSDSIQSLISGEPIEFDSWWEKIRWEGLFGDREALKDKARLVWQYVTDLCQARTLQVASEQPYMAKRDMLATSMPFLIEHKISGALLGLSDILSLDCYDYLHSIMFDLKVESKREDWHRLSPVGYAIVFESVHEVPIDVCCTLYVSFRDGRVLVSKDLFFANNDLRSWWVEERDRKLEIIAQKKDPGMPNVCSENCIYRKSCRGE